MKTGKGKDIRLDNAFSSKNNMKKSWYNLLSSIVLWDDIYIYSNSLQEYDEASVQSRNLYEFFNSDDLLYENDRIENMDISFIHHVQKYKVDLHHGELKKMMENLSHKYARDRLDPRSNYETCRSIEYYSIAQVLGYTYIASPHRRKILNKLFLMNEKLDPSLFMDMLDERVQEIIQEANTMCKRNVFSFRVPVLYNYIQKNAIGIEEELKYAIVLHERKDVVCFRESVKKINSLLKCGNILQARSAIQEANSICDELVNSMYKKRLTYDISIGLSPSINFGGQTKFKSKTILNTTFLCNVARTALYGK